MPIINENDTVSVEELQTTFGDNDRLAAMVTNLIRAPLLVLLSDVEACTTATRATRTRRSIPTVTQLDESIWSLVRDKATGLSKGGMASKLEAARMATTAGENVIIASGKQPGNLQRILAGEAGRHAVRRPRQTRSPSLEALDRLHRPAARPADARRRRPPGGREARAAACWRSASSNVQGDVSQRRRRVARAIAPGASSPAA